MAYSGKYRPTNREKYKGDPDDITYRSSWELKVFQWCDKNVDVVKWHSECTVITYLCATDKKFHRYFMDLKIQFADGRILLVEIKPKKETKAPRKKGNMLKYLTEVNTYMKNVSKWTAAKKYADKQGYLFQIWTEDTLKNIGIHV